VSAPSGLRDLIARDLAPKRPLAPPALRALALVPVAAAIVAAVPALHELRPDLPSIGVVRALGFAIVQAIAGVAIVAAALRESVPGRQWPAAQAVAIVAGGMLMALLLPGLAAQAFDVAPRPAGASAVGVACFRTSALAALPALAASAVLSARAWPLRPAVAGALYGLGAGLIADAGLRLWCEFSAPAHVLIAHVGAVAVSTLLGAAVSVIAGARRARGTA